MLLYFKEMNFDFIEYDGDESCDMDKIHINKVLSFFAKLIWPSKSVKTPG